MNYKILSIILAVLLLGSLIYIFTSDSKDFTSEETQLSTRQVQDEDEKLFFEMEDRRLNRGRGRLIPASKANKQLIKFQKWEDTIRNRGGVRIPYGFGFGVDTLKAFVDKLDSINRYVLADADADKKLTGVRIHLGINRGPYGEDGKEVEFVDAFLVYVRQNGENYQNVDQKYNKNDPKGDLVLNTSKPCPDLCD